jgi:RNA polymerase sigma-70 factor, ECF subfamily
MIADWDVIASGHCDLSHPIWPVVRFEFLGVNTPSTTPRQPGPGRAEQTRAEQSGRDLESLLTRVARGDHAAFEAAYDQLAGPVYGLVRKVLRDPAQSEEIAQEVLLEVWRTASRFDAARGSAAAWVMTIAHRRAVDRVRSETSAARRELKVLPGPVSGDDVAELVETALDRQRVRRCLGTLTPLQAESIKLAYYGGYTYPQVAELLGVALGTVKTRIRDGLIRMRDCMEVT